MRNRLAIIPIILILTGCGGKKNNPQPAPAAAVLTAPAQNEVCTSGTIISATESDVLFRWQSAANTSSYEIVVTNLLNSTTVNQSTAQPQISLNLLRNTPFSWYVISKSSSGGATAQSDTWKFYNSGPGLVTYAPYPAEITSPTFGQSITAATVNLSWKGSAVDNSTIVNYDVYFGITSSPPLLKSNVADGFVNGVTVATKTTYYWKVITRDINGNTSDSGISQFSVN